MRFGGLVVLIIHLEASDLCRLHLTMRAFHDFDFCHSETDPQFLSAADYLSVSLMNTRNDSRHSAQL